ncbi:hypothetical protein Taro_013626 [Colocasia esculenta]|uniref:EamA domain-containing protein n=1 Tax=Colocasia esculenta TaxID=4460 RepID=A0A843UCL1_COLES|nr:hypothetical protein [Colocasia esculenta]
MAGAAVLPLLPNFLSSPPAPPASHPRWRNLSSSPLPSRSHRGNRARVAGAITCCTARGGASGSSRSRSAAAMPEKVLENPPVECIGTGTDVECFANEFADSEADGLLQPGKTLGLELEDGERAESDAVLAQGILEWALLISPFFFWGTAMVAMKEVIPKAGPFFVSAFRLIPAGLMLIGFAGIRGRKQPSGALAWLSIVLFGIVDATCFQGFLAEGLQKTAAGLGSVIIDSQPLTVSILAALLFGESISVVGATGLALGVVGLLLLEALRGRSNPLGVSRFEWPPRTPGQTHQALARLTGPLGSRFCPSRPIGAKQAIPGPFLPRFLYLGETFSPLQLIGALVTVVGIYMVNYKAADEKT